MGLGATIVRTHHDPEDDYIVLADGRQRSLRVRRAGASLSGLWVRAGGLLVLVAATVVMARTEAVLVQRPTVRTLASSRRT